MQNFEPLKKGDKIGVCAPSMGCGEGYYQKRCDNAVKKFKKLGHEIVFTNNCFGNILARSSDAKTRAQEFEQLFFDDQIKGIISMAGGEFEMEMLPYINFEKIKKAKNKFFQGFSDNTCLSFLLATLCDKTSVYSSNFCNFGMKKWHKSINENYDILCGKKVEQISYPKYEVESNRKEEGNELLGYNLTQKTTPKILSNHTKIDVSGLLIGGCLDVLSTLCGTKFDKVKNFVKRNKDKGIIWFFESCDLNILDQLRVFWKFKNAGWFEGVKAILIGRPLNTTSLFDYDYKQANYEHLKDLNVPVVIDLDIGHTSPNWTIVNGANTHFTFDGKKAKIMFE